MYSIFLIALWVLLASVLQALPSKDNHWRYAYFLVAVGVPILGWVTYRSGPYIGIVALAVGALILRWPLIYTTRWIRRQFTR